MKKIVINSLFLACIIFAFSCDKAEDLTDVNFNVVLTKTLPVAVITTDDMTTSVILEATTDPEILKYADKIKRYEITELTFAIENYSAPTTTEIYFDGEIGFSKKTQNEATTSCAISPLNITHVAATGPFPISTCNDILDGISVVFLADNAVKMYMTGTFTKEPVTFDLVVSAKVKITANPL
jgi:hypothetical protein